MWPDRIILVESLTRQLKLAKRKEKRDEAEKELKLAEETGNAETVEKFTKRLVKVTPQHNAECQEVRLVIMHYKQALIRLLTEVSVALALFFKNLTS